MAKLTVKQVGILKSLSAGCQVNPKTCKALLDSGLCQLDGEMLAITEAGARTLEDELPGFASKVGRSNVQRSKAHERKVASMLTNWSGVTFRRRRVEGRGAAVTKVDGTADVICVDRNDCRFSIEAKCGDGFSLQALLETPGTATFTSWWFQATYDANLLTDIKGRQIYPLLFFKVSNVHYVAFLAQSLGDTISIPHFSYNYYSSAGMIAGKTSHSKKNPEIKSIPLENPVIASWRTLSGNLPASCLFFP